MGELDTGEISIVHPRTLIMVDILVLHKESEPLLLIKVEARLETLSIHHKLIVGQSRFSGAEIAGLLAGTIATLTVYDSKGSSLFQLSPTSRRKEEYLYPTPLFVYG